MPNIPKPELEQGAYICYANEPDTIADNAGGGGGGSDNEPYDVHFVVTLTSGTFSDYATIPFIAIDGEEITGFEDVTEPDQQSTYKKTLTLEPGSIVMPNEDISGYTLLDFLGCYELLLMGAVVLEDATPYAMIADKKIADWYMKINDLGEPEINLRYSSDL